MRPTCRPTPPCPTAPRPLSPLGGVGVAALSPALVVANAYDADGHSLAYLFEIDRVPSFDSPDLQVSPMIGEGSSQTSWAPAFPLRDNTLYFWRAAASDSHTMGPFAGSSFFANVANDPPGMPVLLDPVDGRTVGSSTPTLRLRNTADPDGDVLSYEF